MASDFHIGFDQARRSPFELDGRDGGPKEEIACAVICERWQRLQDS